MDRQIFAQYSGTSSHFLMGVSIPDNDGDLKKKVSQNVSKTFNRLMYTSLDHSVTTSLGDGDGGSDGGAVVVVLSTKYSILE
jgi:hypothetical protein